MKEITIKTEKATVIVSSDVDVKIRGNEIILKLIDVIQQKEIVKDDTSIPTIINETSDKHTEKGGRKVGGRKVKHSISKEEVYDKILSSLRKKKIKVSKSVLSRAAIPETITDLPPVLLHHKNKLYINAYSTLWARKNRKRKKNIIKENKIIGKYLG
jgi:hypothetical protein